MNKYINFLLIAILPLLAGCDLADYLQLDGVGQTIEFTANTYYKNVSGTKTEYSGDIYNNIERINWLNTDLIRIYCDQASVSGSDNHFADYSISPTSNAQQISKASIAPVNQGLQWGTGQHTFYALYPSPATTGVNPNKVSINGSTITMTIPESQAMAGKITVRDGANNILGYEYKPDMRYAYMVATAQASPGASVSLSFEPHFSAWEFTLNNETSNSIEISSIYLDKSGTGAKLTGDWDYECVNGISTYQDASSNFAYAALPDFSNGGYLTIEPNKYIKFTLFTRSGLSVRNGQLSINIIYADGTGKRLVLYNSPSSMMAVMLGNLKRRYNLSVPEPSNPVQPSVQTNGQQVEVIDFSSVNSWE